MANIGLQRFYFARLSVPEQITEDMDAQEQADTEAYNEELAALQETLKAYGSLVYDADPATELPEGMGQSGRYSPFIVEGARRCQITYNTADGKLYGDDEVAERWELTLGADIEIEWAPRHVPADYSTEGLRTELMDHALLGVETQDEESEGNPSAAYHLNTENGVWVGFGYVQTQIVNGVKQYRAVKFHKARFWIESEETQTKEERIEWGCPILKGHAEPVELYNPVTGELTEQVRDTAIFTDATTAQYWLLDKFPSEETPEAWADDITVTGVTLTTDDDADAAFQRFDPVTISNGNHAITTSGIRRIEVDEAASSPSAASGLSLVNYSTSGLNELYRLVAANMGAGVQEATITLVVTTYAQNAATLYPIATRRYTITRAASA